jgi:hypothetical protein
MSIMYVRCVSGLGHRIIPVQRGRFEIIMEIAGLAVIVGGPANGLRWNATLLALLAKRG